MNNQAAVAGGGRGLLIFALSSANFAIGMGAFVVIGVLTLVAAIWIVGFVRPNQRPFLDARGVDDVRGRAHGQLHD